MDQLLVSAHTSATQEPGLTQRQIGYRMKKRRDNVNDYVIFKTA